MNTHTHTHTHTHTQSYDVQSLFSALSSRLECRELPEVQGQAYLGHVCVCERERERERECV